MKGGHIFTYCLVYTAFVTVHIDAVPDWQVDSDIEIDFTFVESACTNDRGITDVYALASDYSRVSYSIEPPDAVGRFYVGTSVLHGEKVLRCDPALITEPSYTVNIRLSQEDGQSVLQELTITFVGLTVDTGPEWTTGAEHQLIKYVSTACDSVTTLQATPSDESGVTYNIVSQSPDEAQFDVSDGGDVLQCTLSAITVTTYTVTVRATNIGNGKSTDLTLFINVKVPPTFTDPDPDDTTDGHIIYICETLQGGDEIMTFLAEDEDDDTSRTFSMEDSTDDVKNIFEVVDGKLRVKAGVADNFFDTDEADAVLDYPIVLTVSDGLLSSTVSTKITIQDDNDNAPEFSGFFEAYVFEDSTTGTSVLRVTAVDNDKTVENNQVTLSLSGASEFELDGDVINVAPGASFDVTTKSTYTLTVTASDEVVDDTQSNDQDFTITIIKRPQWTTEAQHQLIKSVSTACDSVTTLQATPTDGSIVTYSFVFQSPNEAQFRVSDSGDVLQCTLSAVTVTTYTVIVRATNSGNGAWGDLTLTINVKVPPTFTDPDPDDTTDEHIIYICETLQAGDEIMTLLAEDEDGDMSRTFSMDDSTDAVKELFEIDGDKLKVKADVAMDFFDIDTIDSVTEYPIVLSVSDGLLSSTITTKVVIQDDNDNAPEFNGSFEASILEESAAGTSVLKVTAVDKDKTEENNQVTLTLSGASQFELDGDVIKVASGASFDVTTKSTYTVTVTASDFVLDDTQSNDQDMTITITTKPVFGKLNTAKETTALENANVETVIYELDVSDRDDTGTLTVTFIKSEDTFTVDGNIVRLKEGQTLDAETKQTYEVQFQANDETYTVDSEILTVNVGDVNDIPPRFTETNPTVDISEAVDEGTVIYQVKAEDDDITDATLTYSLTEIGDSHFEINEATGEIKPKVDLDFLMDSRYNLKVTVKDGMGPDDHSVDTVVTVKLWTPPSVDDPADGSSFSIKEGVDVGDVIKTIVSSDPDGDAPTYTLISQIPDSDPKKFTVVDGTIRANDKFDVDGDDAITSYTLTLSVSDGRPITDNSTCTFNITITDSNDSPPVFEKASYEQDVKETATTGTTVLTVNANDMDNSEPNNQISYSLTGSTNFIIDEDSGDIIVDTDNLEYDTKAQYDMKVTATDYGIPSKSAEVDVTLTLLAEPEFSNLGTETSIDKVENLPAGTTVFNISVTDVDKTWNGEISIISQTPGDMFKVNGMAVQTITSDLDAESDQLYTLKFKLTDGDFEVQSANLKININDVNDNSPNITPVEPVTIPENEGIGSVVVEIEATDDDVTGKELSYSITAGDDGNIFFIEELTGQIVLASAPNVTQYNLSVKVVDSGIPPSSSDVDVTVNVDPSPVDECLPQSPCQNEGICSPSVNSYTCECVPGWTDTNCETNKNECDPDPCENGGTCMDGINTNTCNCTKGWGGDTCTTACTNNKHGRNCLEMCNCNASRLIPGVESQTCVITTGACFCNEHWNGDACETDVNECNNTAVCNETPNLVCENTVGNYYCTCAQGFVNNSGQCEMDITVTPVNAGAGEVVVVVKSSLDAFCPDLSIPTLYSTTKARLEAMLNRYLRSAKRIVVVDITCASLDYETSVVINQTDAVNLANEISGIRNNVEYDGNEVTVNNIEVNGNPVSSATDVQQSASVCQIYTSIETCPRKQECVYTNGRASCEYVETDKTDLLIGLGVGVILPLALMAVTALICIVYRVSKQRQSKTSQSDSWTKENSPWYGRLKSNGLKFNTRNYNGDQFYDNPYFKGSFYDKQRYADVPALGYTSI